MSEKSQICENEIKDIYDTINCFKERFLKNKKSIFSDNKIFTKENLNKIFEGFVENPDESDSSFDDKIKKQLGTAEEAHELFAHIIWLWSLAASDMKLQSKQNDVNKWLRVDDQVQDGNQFFFENGIMSTGQYHKTNKPAELIYIIKFLKKVIENKDKENEIDYTDIIKIITYAPEMDENNEFVKGMKKYKNIFLKKIFKIIKKYFAKSKISKEIFHVSLREKVNQKISMFPDRT